MSADCLFCKISAGDIPATIRYQDEHLIVFEDINPQAARTLAAEMRRYAPDEVFEDVVVFTDMLGELFDLFEEHGQAVAAGDLDAADELRGQIHERVEAAAVEIDVEFDRMTRYVWAAC